MSYLILKDYNTVIQPGELAQVMRNDNDVLATAEAKILRTVRGKLVQKYDIDSELKDITLYDPTRQYKAAQRVYLDGTIYDPTPGATAGDMVLYQSTVYICTSTTNGVFDPSAFVAYGPRFQIYYAKYPVPVFDSCKFYNVGDPVIWKDNIYDCKIATTSTNHETALQYETYVALPVNNVIPDDPRFGAQYWSLDTAYVIPAQVPLTDDEIWSIGDNRCLELVGAILDMVIYEIHSGIAPRNIPELRVKRYDDAKKWLKEVYDGMTTTDLVLLQAVSGKPRQGMRIRYGGNVKNNNTL